MAGGRIRNYEKYSRQQYFHFTTSISEIAMQQSLGSDSNKGLYFNCILKTFEP
jgi:hypothetical protein